MPTLLAGIGTANPILCRCQHGAGIQQHFSTSGTSVPLYEISDSVFDRTSPAYDELTTAVSNVNGVATPAGLSRITVGALDDFG